MILKQQLLVRSVLTMALAFCYASMLTAQTDEASIVTNAEVFFDGDVTKEGIVQIAFDTNAAGDVLASDRNYDVGGDFAALGAQFRCLQTQGKAVICGYKFKGSKSRQRSLGNYYLRESDGKKASYKGTLRIDFCNPEDPKQGATVDRVGLFLEIVKAGHTMVEAYDASGIRIASVLTGEDKTSFVGFVSQRPISWIEVTHNSYTGNEKVNMDFAIDDLVFSKPVPDPSRRIGNKTAFVVDGQITSLEESKIPDDQEFSGWFNSSEFPVYPEPVARFADQEKSKNSGVFVMRSDGSVVHCNVVDDSFVMVANDKIEFPIGSQVGFWGANGKGMQPFGAHVEEGKSVLVTPLYCVTIAEPEVNSNSGTVDFDWEAVAVSCAQPDLKIDRKEMPTDAEGVVTHLEKLGIADPASIKLADTFAVWKSEPDVQPANRQFVRLRDGQVLVFTDDGFRYQGSDGEKIDIGYGESKFSIAAKDIEVLYLPK